MTDITILPAPPSELIAHWPIVGPMLERATPVMLNRFLTIDVLALCITGNGQGWLVRDDAEILAVAITRIENYPRSRGLTIFALSGKRLADYFEQMQNIIIDYAKQAGCQWIECQGRQGWQRVLKMEPFATLLVLDLNGGAMK